MVADYRPYRFTTYVELLVKAAWLWRTRDWCGGFDERSLNLGRHFMGDCPETTARTDPGLIRAATTTVTGQLVFGIFATLAEFERDLIHERTMTELAAARGRSDGRPWIMTKQKLKAAMADRDNAASDVAVQLGMSVSTPYAYVDAKGQPRERASELLGKRGVRSKIAA